MDALQLLMWSILLYVAGGVASLLLARREELAIKVAGLSAMAGGLLGLASAVTALTGAQTLHWQAVGPSRLPILSCGWTVWRPLWCW